ncbi:rRNA maturation RNase YbeY [Burkholderiaceae bacterium DAT-1]|nr:rRNA maturation RNase YbeY [Burkholderiaceae bacterium DAT-1]
MSEIKRVVAITADGKEKTVKAEELRIELADGAIIQIVLDTPDGLLIGTPADDDAPSRLVIRPGAANAMTVAVERDILVPLPPAELELVVQDVVKAKGVPGKKLMRKWIESALEAGVQAEVTVRIVDEEEGRQLNSEYRGKDYATNVLSFAYSQDEPIPGAEDVVMGDLVLCAPVVAREAEEQGKELAAHWAHLLIHGALHLQGYDHEDDIEADAMESLETAIMEGLGFADPYASEKGAPDA